MCSRPELDVLFQRLAGSAFRRRFKLGPAERKYLQARGPDTMERHACDLVTRRLAPAQPAKDGKQTPFRGHPVFVAQHATATCCRTCLAKWHRIPAGRALEEAEVEHVVAVITRWLAGQGGVHVAAARQSSLAL